MSGGWYWAFAAGDTDGEWQDLDIFFECIFLWYEREDAGLADIKEAFFISFCDSIAELFSSFFCVVASSLIVEVEYGLANIGARLDSVGCFSVLVANFVGIEDQIGGIEVLR